MMWVLGSQGPIQSLWNSISRFMIHFSKHFPLLLGFACCLAFMALAQEEKKDPLDNFDGSKKEITVANPEAQKGTEASESGSGQISLGELSEDKIKEDKVTESRENELETKNAKSDQTKDLIQSALATVNRPLSASGLELNQPEVFPVDI